jgi:hypothetical protein
MVIILHMVATMDHHQDLKYLTDGPVMDHLNRIHKDMDTVLLVIKCMAMGGDRVDVVAGDGVDMEAMALGGDIAGDNL